MGKKRSKVKYDLVETLRPMAFPSELEELTTRLYEEALKGSIHLWDKMHHIDVSRADEKLRSEFYKSASQGMRDAQDEIISIIQSGTQLEYPKELLLKGIADAIAWQIIGYQLCYARLFFKSCNQPSLYNCNFDSVVFAARKYIQSNPDSIALLSDLTSFVQVGDLLIYDHEKGLTICEVKEGSMNAKISDIMKFHLESKCNGILDYFAQKEGRKAFKQLQRTYRQVARMAHVSTVLKTGSGKDPDTYRETHIPEPFFKFQSWDDRLISTIKSSEEKGWAVDVIDNCLFIGVYSSEYMRSIGHIIFNSWFDDSGGTPDCPRTLLIDCMRIPLALPIFSRFIPDDFKFDILFGRKQVCMGICIDALLKECKIAGLSVRFATNKEKGKIVQKGCRPYEYKGKAIFISKGEHKLLLMDGVFLRIIFHGQSPISLIQSMLNGIDKKN